MIGEKSTEQPREEELDKAEEDFRRERNLFGLATLKYFVLLVQHLFDWKLTPKEALNVIKEEVNSREGDRDQEQ